MALHEKPVHDSHGSKTTTDSRFPVTGEARDRSFLDYVILALKGFCMGASDVVPGVSGGTMAFILGIYEELILAIRSFDLKAIRLLLAFRVKAFLDRTSWRFLFSVGLGILLAVFSLARVLHWLLEHKPILIWSFFFGLILASLITVSRRIHAWNPLVWLLLFLGAGATYCLVGLVPASPPDEPWFLFLCGAVAICAMILPGISGSFILVLMGQYYRVLGAVKTGDLYVLSLVAAGAVTGIAVFSRILAWLFRKHHDLLVASLTGLMLGSLRKVWPWKSVEGIAAHGEGGVQPMIQANVFPDQFNAEVSMALALMAAGLLVVFALDRVAEKIR